MNTQKNNSLGPFIVLTFIYFIVGFLTTVNGQFQGPLKIAFLSHTDELRNTLTTFISFFFFHNVVFILTKVANFYGNSKQR